MLPVLVVLVGTPNDGSLARLGDGGMSWWTWTGWMWMLGPVQASRPRVLRCTGKSCCGAEVDSRSRVTDAKKLWQRDRRWQRQDQDRELPAREMA